MTSKIQQLGSPVSPFVHIAESTGTDWLKILEDSLPEPFFIQTFDSTKMQSKNDVFCEMATKLKFPDYFGYNWDALEECLADLEWCEADGYVFVFEGAEQILSSSLEALKIFFDILNEVGKGWTEELHEEEELPIPFHVILQVEKSNESGFAHMLKALDDIPFDYLELD